MDGTKDDVYELRNQNHIQGRLRRLAFSYCCSDTESWTTFSHTPFHTHTHEHLWTTAWILQLILMFLLFFEDEDKEDWMRTKDQAFLVYDNDLLPTYISPGTTLLLIMPQPLLYIHTYTRVTSFLFNVWLFLFALNLFSHGSHTLLALLLVFGTLFLSPKEWNGIGWGGKRDLEYG